MCVCSKKAFKGGVLEMPMGVVAFMLVFCQAGFTFAQRDSYTRANCLRMRISNRGRAYSLLCLLYKYDIGVGTSKLRRSRDPLQVPF